MKQRLREEKRRQKEVSVQNKKLGVRSRQHTATTTRSATQPLTFSDTTSVQSPNTTAQFSPVSIDSEDPSTSMQSCETTNSSVDRGASLPASPNSSEEDCECSFCYRKYSDDGGDWVRCACNRWVHESCVEDVLTDVNGDERFCPFCLN